MMAQFVYGRPIMSKYVPASNYATGDVIVVGAMPFVAHSDNPMFGGTTPVIVDSLACFGGIYLMAADGAIAVGQDVYWSASASKVSLTAAGNTHFGKLVGGPNSPVASDPGPATSGDLCYVLHDPQGGITSGARAVSTVAAAGGNIATAGILNQGFNLVTAGDGSKGVILPTPITGLTVRVRNSNNGGALKVYPNVGGTINELTANSNYNMANYTMADFVPWNATTWYTLPLLAS